MRPDNACRKAGGVLVALSLVLLAGLAPATEDHRDNALVLLRTGDTAAALPLLREYAAAHPDDALMLYNLACAEAGAGTAEAAVAAVRACLVAGFEDIDQLREDPDLAAVRDDPAFAALLTEEESRLVLLARERGADLVEGRIAGPLPLAVRGDPPTGDDPSVRLRWLPLGLEIELTGEGVWTGLADPGAPPPWSGGPAAMVTLALPGARRDYASANSWLLAFGIDHKQPVGALRLPGRAGWQRISELGPRLVVDEGGRLTLRTTIPWHTIMPFHPLVDPELGLNVAVRVPRPGGGYHVAELLPDPARFTVDAARHRAAVITFDPRSTAAEAFVGRVRDSVSRGGALPLEFVAVVREGGRGTVTVDFLDTAGNSVLPDGAQEGGLDLAAGVNRIERAADFSGLRTGSYQVRADLVFPAGARAEWSTTILHLPPGWDDDLDERIAALPERDRPTATYLLETVHQALDRHLPRRHPGAIATTLAQLTTLLERGEHTGTLLPDAGTFTLVYPGPGGSRPVEGFLAADAGATDDVLPVVLLTDAAGYEGRIRQRMLLFDERQPVGAAGSGPRLAFLVPHLPGAAAEQPAAAAAVAAIDWARAYFGADQVLLVGVDGVADEAFLAAARCPAEVTALAVFAGGRVSLPEEPDSLAGLRPELAVTWFSFPMEAAADGNALRLRNLVGEHSAALVEEREVRGGLSLSQVGDRTVLWAREAAVNN